VSYATIDELRSQLGAPQLSERQLDYNVRMMHTLPDGAVVKRDEFILDRCRQKLVVEFGASGPMTKKIQAVASGYMGIDRTASKGIVAFDMDDVAVNTLPWPTSADVVICGEVLEHLTNPGWFLHRLRLYARCPVVISVPNALGAIAQKHMKQGIENVNVDHVAWYSPRTLKTLLDRYAFTIREFAYYNGTGPDAEGLVVVAD
jgi:hypothetical protein